MRNGSVIEYPIKNFKGLNLKDAADKVADNEFTLLQNVYQSSKGIFQKRWGSTSDVSTIPGASRISGVWRHYARNRERFSLYHCVPDASLLPDNAADLVLADVPAAYGKIFGGGAVQTIYVCYSWIGLGLEQVYNSKNRGSYPAPGSFPMYPSANPAHQTITLAANTNVLRVTVPAFPSGIRGANIFMAVGNPASGNPSTSMTYVGTITTSAGSLDITAFIGPRAAKPDAITVSKAYPKHSSTGALKVGTYFLSFAWIIDNEFQEGQSLTYYGASIGTGLPLAAGTGAPATTLGVTSVSSATAGALTAATSYDFIATLNDPDFGEVLVSTTMVKATAALQTSLDITFPVIPQGMNQKSTWNLYFANNTAVPLQVKTGIAPNTVLNWGTVPPASGTKAPPTQQLPGAFSQVVTLTGNQNSIHIEAPAGASANGGRSLFVFLGTQAPTLHPMTCVGLINIGNGTDTGTYLNIDSIPSHNASSCPRMLGAEALAPLFAPLVNDGFVGGMNYSVGVRVKSRFGFLMAKKPGGALYEIFPSRTLLANTWAFINQAAFSGDNGGDGVSIIDLHNFAPQPKTANDLYKLIADVSYVQPFDWATPVIDPHFCHHLGISYFANGADIPWQTDGYSLGQLSSVKSSIQTTLPPIPRFIFEYQNGLVVAGAKAGNQIFGSNASAPQNWATGGSGTLLRFVTVGDAVGSGVTAYGIFTPATDSTNNPGSFMIAFKKNGVWMVPTIPDPQINPLSGVLGFQSGGSMQQISGRVGCTAYRTVVQTPAGVIFLGSDGIVYLINRVAEPAKIGIKVLSFLSHLPQNDNWMQLCTAVYHDNHYKLSFPSLSASGQNVVVNDSELWADLRSEGDGIKWVGPHVGRSIGSQVVFVGDDDDFTRLGADGSSVRTLVLDSINSLDDLGVNISSKIKSKIYRFGEEGHLKRFFGALVDCFIDESYTNNLLFEGFADEYYQQVNRLLSSGGGVWDASQWNQANYADAMWQGFSFLFGGTNLTGRTFQWELSHSNPSPFALASLTLLLKPEKRMVIK